MKLLVSALEPSANLHLKPVLEKLGHVQLEGIFDPAFGQPFLPSSAFSVMGFLDVVPKIAKAKRAIKALAHMSETADHVLLIDSPAFNLPLAKAIKERNPKAKITYYILPQVWAWKAKRVAKVEKYCDNLAAILPFETQWYAKATYVGHPLLDEISQVKKSLTCKGVIAFLPGSRPKEIARLMPLFKKVAAKLGQKALLVVPSFIAPENIPALYGDTSGFTVCFNTHEALYASDFAFICSGTATLEAALIGTPFVLAYKANALDYQIAKRFVKLPFVGLANVIFHFLNEPPLHQELLQGAVSEVALLEAYAATDSAAFFERAQGLRAMLGQGSASNVAKMIQV